MNYKIFVSKGNITNLTLDPRVIDIITVDGEYNNYIIDADCKIPLLVNKIYYNSIPDGMYSYPIIINDVRESLISMSIRLNKLRINHPKSFMFTRGSLSTIGPYLEDNKKYILKADLQARGMYKLIVDKKVLTDYVGFLSTHVDIKLDKESLKELFNLKKEEKEELTLDNNSNDSYEKSYDERVAYYIDHVLNNSLGEVRSKEEVEKQIRHYFCGYSETMFVQELINIKNEYRVVWFNTGDTRDIVILKRTGFDIRNAGVSYDIETEVLDEASRDELLTTGVSSSDKNSDTVQDMIVKLGTSLNTYRLSIDLYEDYNGNIGIIEYQTELYEHEIPDIVKLSTKAMVYTIENLK